MELKFYKLDSDSIEPEYENGKYYLLAKQKYIFDYNMRRQKISSGLILYTPENCKCNFNLLLSGLDCETSLSYVIGHELIIYEPTLENSKVTLFQSNNPMHNENIIIIEKGTRFVEIELQELENVIPKNYIAEIPECKIVLAHPDAKVPIKAHDTDAGFDLVSCEDVEVWPGDMFRKLVDTGIKIQFSESYYARIAPRSGLSIKQFIDIGAGVVDSGFCNTVKVLIINHGEKYFTIKKGDRIAQLIFEKHENKMKFVQVDSLDPTSRGETGFGASGK